MKYPVVAQIQIQERSELIENQIEGSSVTGGSRQRPLSSAEIAVLRESEGRTGCFVPLQLARLLFIPEPLQSFCCASVFLRNKNIM